VRSWLRKIEWCGTMWKLQEGFCCVLSLCLDWHSFCYTYASPLYDGRIVRDGFFGSMVTLG